MSFDLNALMKQAQEMQAQMAQVQEEASKETAEASAGGGMVTVRRECRRGDQGAPDRPEGDRPGRPGDCWPIS